MRLQLCRQPSTKEPRLSAASLKCMGLSKEEEGWEGRHVDGTRSRDEVIEEEFKGQSLFN